MLFCVFFYSHFTSIENGEEDFVPRSFSALQRYCPECEDWMEWKESCCPWSVCPGEWSVVTLVQVYFATGLASLVQVRFTELPSFITPGGVHPTEGVSGASVDSYITLVCISKYKNKALGSCKASVMSISKHCIESSLSSLFLRATCRLSFYVAHYRQVF